MRHSTFLSLIVPALNSRDHIGSLPFRSSKFCTHLPDGRTWKASSNIDSKTAPPVTAFATSSSSVVDPTLETRRISLSRIFNGSREYLFTTRKNIRGYEWKRPELEDLFESISEIDGTKNDALELNTIVLMKRVMKRETEEELGKDSGVYDVHDGQQRLATLSLLLAAIRDVLREKFPDSKDSQDTAKEVSDMIFPTKVRKKDVCRIKLRRTGGDQWLYTILSSKDSEGNDLENIGSVLPKKGSWGKLGIPKYDQCVLSAYNYFRQQLEERREKEIFDLIDHFNEDVFLMVQIPSDTIIARNIVMGQGKGKNVEAVDYFKGIVCFNYNEIESVQDSTLKSWDNLCDDVGRDVVGDSCLLLAQRYQETKVKRNSELSLVEQFLRDLSDRIDPDDSNSAESISNSGKYIFDTYIVPASHALHNFRKSNFDLDEDENKGTEPASFAFLRSAAGIATCKEIEMVVLDLICEYRRTATDSSRKKEIAKTFKHMESIALWMMITKPKPKDRFQWCLSIIKEPNQTALTADEKTQICEVLDKNDFGKPSDRKKAAAVLERLNEHILVVGKSTRLQPMQAGRHIEHVLPQEHKSVEEWNDIWSPTDASKWKQRLGNLALLDKKSNSKIGNKSFETKKKHLGESPYPLTKDIAKSSQWDIAAVKENHKKYIDLAKKVFKL